ncbi:MucBP domain-containing protein, partial [Streptococcus suis]
MRKNKKLSKGILNSVVTTTVAVTPLAVGAITAVTFAETGLMVVNATEVSAAAATNQSGIDAISANNGQYTVTSEHTNFKWTDILKNPIIALKMTDGTYKYKKFSGSVTMDIAKAAYVADEFVDAATYKTANGPLKADDKVYIIQETDFTSAPTSIEESYDLTKFHHRENLVFGGDSISEGATIDDAASDSVLVALARPGSFVSEIEFKNMENPGNPSIYLPEENNTLLVVDNIREAVEQVGPNDQSYTNFGLFLSHIAVSDDKVNKPNTVMKLSEGVEVIFADSSGQQTTFAEAMNEIMNTLRYDNDEWKVLNPQQKLKFKFIVKKDGQIIQEDKNWREITLHVYNTLDAVKNLVKTTLENTENNFAEGIVDNIDFSGLPEVMKNEAVDMEKKYPNVDGSTPQDGALPQFSNPTNKQYNWVTKDEETSNGDHATSPARYFPYDMDLFSGSGSRITEKLRGYITELPDYKEERDNPSDVGEISIPPTDHDKELIDYYSLGPIFTKTMFGHNFTPEPGGVNESYWNSLVQDIPIPQLDFEPKVNLDIVTLSENTQPNPKGTVKIVYKALNADGTDVDSSVVLRADVTDTEDAAVGTPWNAAEQEKDEKPETLTYEATNTVYHLVKTAVVVPGVDGESTQTEGTVVAGDTVVTYFYAPEQVDRDVKNVTGSVTIKYENTLGAPIKDSLPDTENALISTTPTTQRYYMLDGKRVNIDPQPVDGETENKQVTYNATEKRTDGVEEKPSIIEHEGTKYHFIKLKENSATETGNVPAGDTVVTYVYAPEQTRQVSTPSNGSVIVEYKLEGSETPETPEGTKLQADFNDTTDQLVSTSTVTETYYVDANGVEKVTNTSEPVVTNTNATYEVTKDEAPDVLTIGGKTYHKVRVNGQEKGTLPAGETKVTYYYREVPTPPPSESKGNVVVKHYKEGTTEEVKDGRTTDEQVVGENYDVSGDKVTGRFTGKDGKTYEYVSTQGNPTDTIKEGTTEVIYYYKEVPSESKGNVVVKHYKEGTTDEVKDGRTTDEQVVGENYDVSGDKVTGRFTGKDGKTYEYVSTQGNPTDTIKEGTTEV